MRKTAYVGRVVMSPAPHHALRHAGRATAVVGVAYGADTVELWIYDVGAGTMDGLRAEDLASALARMTHQFTCVCSPRRARALFGEPARGTTCDDHPGPASGTGVAGSRSGRTRAAPPGCSRSRPPCDGGRGRSWFVPQPKRWTGEHTQRRSLASSLRAIDSRVDSQGIRYHPNGRPTPHPQVPASGAKGTQGTCAMSPPAVPSKATDVKPPWG